MPTPSGGYEKSCVVYFTPEVMRWVAPVALVLIFLVQFFPWVGIYPGGVPVFTQGAWGAAFGLGEEDDSLVNDLFGKNGIPAEQKPDVSALMIFYVLLFLPVLVVTVAVLLIEMGVVSVSQFPPAVQPLLRWRWAAVAGLNLIILVFLALQIVLGFSLESKIVIKATEMVNKLDKSKKEKAIAYGADVSTVSRTLYLWIAFWLHVVAVIGAWTAYCLHDRPAKPAPKLELV